MGKASKWFRGLLGLRRPDGDSPSPTVSKPPKEKRRWSFVKSYREKEHHVAAPSDGDLLVQSSVADPGKQAVAEAAIAATHAAAVVAGFTCSNASGDIIREEWAAIKIQAAFRGSLARKALRALKGVVKLQAMVRGDIDRKRTAERVQRMQHFLHSRIRVRPGRTQIPHTSFWTSKSFTSLHGPATPDKFESPVKSESSKYDHSSSVLKRTCSNSRSQINGNRRSDEQPWTTQRRSWTRACSMDDEKNIRILEIDTGKPHITSKRGILSYSCSQPLISDYYSQSFTNTKDSTSYQSGQSPSSCEVQSYNPFKINEVEESSFNSSQNLSASSGSRRSPCTPTRSDGYGGDYYEYPNYMAYTESSKAKVRSFSVPKQRPLYERSSNSSMIRYSHYGFCDSKLASQRVSELRASFTSKEYPGSGLLDKLGLPVGYRY